MFAKKLVLIASAVALALTHVAAVEQANHVKIHVGFNSHHKEVLTVKAVDSKAGSVAEDADVGEEEDDELDEERAGSSSDDDDDDEVGDEEDGSGSGGKNEAAVVAPAKPSGPASAACKGKDESPTSVEGVAGIFCVTGQPCTGDVMGACPGNSTDLPLGAMCGKVKSGVLGCIPVTKKTNAAKVKLEAQHLIKELDSQFFLKKKLAEEKKTVTVVKVKKASHKKH